MCPEVLKVTSLFDYQAQSYKGRENIEILIIL